MTLQEINQRLYELISEKNFSDLTEDEKTWVNNHSDENTYRTLRKAHLKIADAETADSLNSPPVSDQMKAALNKRRTGQSMSMIRFIQRPIPLWQAAATVVVLISLFLLFRPQAKIPSHIVLQMGDTLEVSKPQFTATWHKDTLILTERKNYTPQTSPTENLADNNDQNVAGISIYTMDQLPRAKAGGKSMAEDSLLRQFEIVSL